MSVFLYSKTTTKENSNEVSITIDNFHYFYERRYEISDYIIIYPNYQKNYYLDNIVLDLCNINCHNLYFYFSEIVNLSNEEKKKIIIYIKEFYKEGLEIDKLPLDYIKTNIIRRRNGDNSIKVTSQNKVYEYKFSLKKLPLS